MSGARGEEGGSIISTTMIPERLQPPFERKPAIDPESLRLPDGQYANKMTLQQIAYDACFPVPRILTIEEVSARFAEGEKALNADPTDYYMNGHKWSIFLRGFLTHPVDLHAVDVVPTSNAYCLGDIERFKDYAVSAASRPLIQKFLRVNFGLKRLPEVKMFFQEAVDDRALYLSV